MRILAFVLALPLALAAQQPLTLRAAVENALKNYPSIRVQEETVLAAAAGIQLARTAYLPKVDGLAQFNRGTRNNVFGLLMPQSVLPSMSGPVIGSNNFGTVWGSAIGVLVSWEPFDFGLRAAQVEAAGAGKARAEAARERSRFEVAATTADAYLTWIAAEQTVAAAQASLDRAAALEKITGALVNAQLRPGADQSRAEAETVAARTQLVQARQAVATARATLAQFAGGDPAAFQSAPANLLKVPEKMVVSAVSDDNPFVKEQGAVVDQIRAQIHALERAYFPKFAVQASAYSRGSGAETNGGRLGLANGLAPNVQNYALGLTITFPAMDIYSIRAREAAENARVRAETARRDQILNDFKAQLNRAAAAAEGSRQVAENTPTQVTAAKAAVTQAMARYQAGLGGLAEVAEAQRLLAQSEIDDALARLNIWRALLQVAVATGDLAPFLEEASR